MENMSYSTRLNNNKQRANKLRWQPKAEDTQEMLAHLPA